MWDKQWIRLLRPGHKLFWVYILSKCDHAGIWEVDIDLAAFQLGIKLDIKELLEAFKDKITEVGDGSKWFIPGFVYFQYGELNPSNRVHESVLSLLRRYKIQAPYKPLISPIKGTKDKDKDKDITKVKVKDSYITDEDFEKIWEKYPRKKGKERARAHFNAQVNTRDDLININKALDNYIIEIKRMGTEEEHIKHGSTWFNQNWKDDINYQPPGNPGSNRAENKQL